MSAPTHRDPTGLDWDRADDAYALLVEDRASLNYPDTDATENRHERWLAGETR